VSPTQPGFAPVASLFPVWLFTSSSCINNPLNCYPFVPNRQVVSASWLEPHMHPWRSTHQGTRSPWTTKGKWTQRKTPGSMRITSVPALLTTQRTASGGCLKTESCTGLWSLCSTDTKSPKSWTVALTLYRPSDYNTECTKERGRWRASVERGPGRTAQKQSRDSAR
jgi:hypothetical protein